MTCHQILIFLISVSILCCPSFSFSPVQTKSNSFQIRTTGLQISKKLEPNPYRIVTYDVPIVYKAVPISSVLLSVDLGLRSGFAFFNSTGILIGFKDHRFDTLLNLKASIMVELEKLSELYNLTHFVLEGDAVYGAIWASAIDQFAAGCGKKMETIYVAPAEWRERILLSKERRSGKDAKCAARLISRQIMWRSGMDLDYYQGPMNTDVAEAIMIGHYAVNDKLLWSSQLARLEFNSDSTVNSIIENGLQAKRQNEIILSIPLIERFSNGNVILPGRGKIEIKV